MRLPCTFDDDLSIRFSSSDWSMSSGETTVILYTSETVFGSVGAVPYVPTNFSIELPSPGSGTSIFSSSG